MLDRKIHNKSLKNQENQDSIDSEKKNYDNHNNQDQRDYDNKTHSNMNQEVINKPKVALTITISTLLVYLLFRFFLPLFYPFIFGYFIVVAILPLVHILNKRFRLPKVMGGLVTLVLAFGFLYILISSLGYKLINQIRMLFENIPVYFTLISTGINEVCVSGEKMFGLADGTITDMVQNNMDGVMISIQNNFIPTMTEQTFGMAQRFLGVFTLIFITLLSVVLILQDMDSMKKFYREFLFYQELHTVVSKLADAGVAYLRAQGILMLITAIICSAAFFLIGNEYALLIGLAIGIFDAFPVLGSGFILVPWGVMLLINKNLFGAAIILSAYLLCQLVRQFLEPKLLGNRLGIKPIFTLMSMYIGVKLFGFTGFILGPIALVLIITIVKFLCPCLNAKKEGIG